MRLRGFFSSGWFAGGAERVRRILPELDRAAWPWVILPAAVCLSLILSTGPMVQETIVGLLSSDAATVYGSAYEDSLIKFPTLGEWLLAGFHWSYLLMAAVPVLFAARVSRFSKFVVRLAAASFLSLCAADLAFGLIDGTLTLPALLINVASNLAGSLLLAPIFGALFWSYEKTRGAVSARLASYAGAATLALLGLLLSSLCYFVLAYFYKPVSANFELVLKMPIQGSYFGQSKDRQKPGEDPVRPFSVLPEGVKGGIGKASMPGEATAINWHSGQPASVFDLTIDFFSDCVEPADLRRLPPGPVSIRRENVKSVKLIADEGMKDLFIAQDPKNGFAYGAKTPNIFWMKKTDPKKAETTVDFFGGPDAVFSNGGSDGQLYYLNFALMRHSGKPSVARVSPRNLTFSVDGEKTSLTFRRPPQLDPKGKMNCKAFKAAVPRTASDAKQLTLDVPEGTYLVGARIQITPRPIETVEEFRDNANRLQVTANGWSQVAGIKDADLAGNYLGRADLLIVEDGIADLRIDGKSVETKRTDQFAAVGDIDGRYEDDLSLHFSGKGKALWLDGERRNPTRWERLPLEVQLFILTAALAALGGLLRTMRPVARRFLEDRPLDGLA